jgi:tetratricopeptide (TPR) repeat protein
MIAAILLTLAQSTSAVSPSPAPRALADDQLELCMDKARTDPTSAISEASEWLSGVSTEDGSYPQQCLGMAYTALLRWEAAERAFLAAREAAPQAAHFRRAQLAAMAGNAALAEGRGEAALAGLDLAAGDAEASGDKALQAITQVDRARALVLQGDTMEAGAALASARSLDPQSPYAWLLSATLSRRLGNLDEAQAHIESAAALAPEYPEIGLEAGVIAMLRGKEAAAVESWRSVIRLEPNGDAAIAARGYLEQVGETASEAAASR